MPLVDANKSSVISAFLVSFTSRWLREKRCYNTHQVEHTLCRKHKCRMSVMYTKLERLTMRPVTTSDVDNLFSIYGDPATNTFNPAGPYPDLAHARTVLARWMTHWEEHAFGNWAISLSEAPEKVIGFGGLSISTYGGITINNLGYRFSTDVWGKGLATEFSLCAINYGFNELQLNEISGVVRKNHLASQKVLSKAGLKYLREVNDVANAPPSLLFNLTLNEWRSKRL